MSDLELRLIDVVGGPVVDVGGSNWYTDALNGEFGLRTFTHLNTGPGTRAYLASGGVDPGRDSRGDDWGYIWEVNEMHISGDDAAGIFSVQIRNGKHGKARGFWAP